MNIEGIRGRSFAFSDYVSDIASEVAERVSPTSNTIKFGLDFILSHFGKPSFPRTISTRVTEGRQVLVYNKDEALAWYKAANCLDCKINAYPKFIDWKGINLQAPNFIFIDLDLGKFKSRLALDLCLNETLKNISQKFNVTVYPTVLWSGRGYHIYLPVGAFILERESEFNRFGNPSRRFLQFVEQFLSNNKADPEHTKGLSFKNAMLRIPGSFNSKNGTEEIKIIQKWDGNRPSIKPLLFRFDLYLLISKSKELHKRKSNKQNCYGPMVFSTDWSKKLD